MSSYLGKTSEHEEVFKRIGLELVFKAKSHEELNELVETHIKAAEEFQQLPSYRRYAVLQFIEGAQRGTAKLVGQEADGKYKPKKVKPPEDIPRAVKKLQPDAEWKKHPNGGGWVSSTAYVAASAKVGYKAIVYGNARVTERAQIYGAAKVHGDAEVYGTAHVHGLAEVSGHARIFDGARVLGKVRVGGQVIIGGRTMVRGAVVLEGNEELIDERVTRTSSVSSTEREASGA